MKPTWMDALGAALLSVTVVAAFALHTCGCGGATPEVRTAYALEQAHCLANERAIVDRAGTTLDEDREALELERTRCDAALAEIYGGPE